MPALKLSRPDSRYATSFADALREGLHLHQEPEDEIRRVETDFDGWLREKFDLSIPVQLADGSFTPRVPHSDFWLVDDDGRFYGRISVRHEISTKALQTIGGHIGYAVRASERRKGYGHLMMQLVRPLVREIGLQKALITCRDDNAGSIRIIEAAGGILQDKIVREDGLGIQRRYWIDYTA